VISDAFGLPIPLALRWVSLDEEDSTFESFLGINRAQTWTEFVEALQSFVAPGQNFVYADVEGNIGYVAPGQYPIRAASVYDQPNQPFPFKGLLPELGTGQFDWQGFIPFEQLPQVFNPDSGLIVSANNRVAPDNYPYPLSFEWAEPYRAERILQLLQQDPLSLADMQAIQLDQTTLLYRDFRPILEAVQGILERAEPRSQRAIQWTRRLLNWDGDLNPRAREATVFQTWYNELTKFAATAIGQSFLPGDAIEPMPRFLLRAFTEGDPALGGSPTAALTAAATTFQQVIEGFGATIPRWGEVHQVVFEHPVLPFIHRQEPFGGDRYTINKGQYNSETFLMDTNGPNYRQILDFADLNNSRFIAAIGQSGNPVSPFFDNLLEPWLAGEYRKMQTEGFPVAVNLNLQPEADSLIGEAIGGLVGGDGLLVNAETIDSIPQSLGTITESVAKVDRFALEQTLTDGLNEIVNETIGSIGIESLPQGILSNINVNQLLAQTNLPNWAN
jgi:penicillin G amidase